MAITISTTGILVAITAGRMLAVSTTGEGAVDIVSGVAGASAGTRRVTSAAELVLGPYGADAQVRVRAIGASTVTYVDRLKYVPVQMEVDPVTGAPTGNLKPSSTSGTSLSSGVAVVTGVNAVGEVLTATPSATYSFFAGQWKRDGIAIPGQTALTYTQTSLDVDCALSFSPTNPVYAATGGRTVGNFTNGVLAGNRLQVPTTFFAYPNLTGSQVERWAPAAGDVSNLVFTDLWWYLSSGTFLATAPAAGGDALMKKFVEYPQGTFTAVLYAGASTYTLGTATKQVSSDPVAGLTIPAGARYWEHTISMGISGTEVATMVLPANASTLGVTDCKYTAAAGGVPAHQATGQASVNFFGSSVISGTIAARGVKSVIIEGDSIAFGQGDVTTAGSKGGSGYLARKMDQLGLAYCKYAVGGASASNLAGQLASANVYLDPYIALLNSLNVTHVINEAGGGDVRLGRTQAQVTADVQAILAKFPTKKRGMSTFTPRVDTTDGYITVANQTPKTDGQWPQVEVINAAIRAGIVGVDFVVDASATGSSAVGSSKWKAPPARTADGVHPNSFCADELATGTDFALS